MNREQRLAAASRLYGLCDCMEHEPIYEFANTEAVVSEMIYAVFADRKMTLDEFVWYLAELLGEDECENMSEDGFACSKCDWRDSGALRGVAVRYCPNCGRKVDE